MTTPFATGWDVFNAVNDEPVFVVGGRVFAVPALPWLYQDSYGVYHGAGVQAHAELLLIDAMKWLRGGQASGTIAVGSDNSDLSWYSEGSNTPAVGAHARATLASAGFTVAQFSGTDLVTAMASANVLVFDWSHLDYDWGSQNTALWAAIESGDKALFAIAAPGFGRLTQRYGFGCLYAYGQGPAVTLYGYAGAEAIFDRTFSGAGTVPVHSWGGRMTVAASGTPGDVTYGETYPSTQMAGWKNATASAHWPVFGTYTQHADSGSGDSW